MDSDSPEFDHAQRRLRRVAILFLIMGLLNAIAIIFSLCQGHIKIRLGVLGIPVYFGLLALKSGWRICALVLTWLGMIVFPAISFYAMFSNIPTGIKCVWAIAAMSVLLLFAWIYSVLTDLDVQDLFEHSDRLEDRGSR